MNNDELLKQAQNALRNWKLSDGHAALVEAMADEIIRLRARIAEFEAANERDRREREDWQ